MTERNGIFITFEGSDAAGKSTQSRLLSDTLRSDGHDVVLTREPGGSPGAEALRELILFGQAELSPRAEIMALFAARQDHVDQKIAPALRKGAIVICDRFTDSTRAYQGYGRANGDPAIIALIDRLDAMIGLVPDMTVLLRLERAQARARLAARGGREDRFERDTEAFHVRVADGIDAIAAAQPERFLAFDAAATVDRLAADVAQAVRARLPVR
jgi:dTMP kinase